MRVCELPDLVTLKEAAAVLRICSPTLRKQIRAGKISVVEIGARKFVQRASLEQFILANHPQVTLPASRLGTSPGRRAREAP